MNVIVLDPPLLLGPWLLLLLLLLPLANIPATPTGL